MKKAIVILVLAVLMSNLSCLAEEADMKAFDTFKYVYDLADVIDSSVEDEIDLNNRRLQKACGSQIVLITVAHTEIPLGDYAFKVFEKIGIGDSILNNGILLVFAIDDDDYYLATGGDEDTGIDKLYPSEEIRRDFDAYLEDYFANKEYSQGAKSMFEALFRRVSGLYGVNIPYYRIQPSYQQ